MRLITYDIGDKVYDIRDDLIVYIRKILIKITKDGVEASFNISKNKNSGLFHRDSKDILSLSEYRKLLKRKLANLEEDK